MGSQQSRLVCIGVGACLLLTIAGCGKGGAIAGETAEETANAFVAALNGGNLEQAATAFDYVTSARQQNEDWDDIASGQRKLIVGKLTEAKATELEAYKQCLGDDIVCASVSAQGVALLKGSAGAGTLQLAHVEGAWKIKQAW